MASYYHTPGPVLRGNALLLIGTVGGTFVALRLLLGLSPDSDFTVGRWNVHHLFTGLVLITAGGVPLALFRAHTPWLRLALITFGVGLGMALDEWVYLIATDGSNASYLLPVSFWGGAIVVGVALAYAAALAFYRLRLRPHSDPPRPEKRPG